MANDLEREEEGLTNNLLRKLSTLRSEKDVTDSEVEALKKLLEKMRNEQEQVACDGDLFSCTFLSMRVYHYDHHYTDITSSLFRPREK